jgi:preprotein translocase subunit YajC
LASGRALDSAGPKTKRWKGEISLSGGNGGSLFPLLLLAGLFLVMYVLVLRPQTKRRREMQSMQQNLQAGAYIVTVGGLYGTVVSADDEAVVLEVAPGVTNKYARAAIARLVDPAAATSQKPGTSSGSEASDPEEDQTPPGDAGTGKTLR